MKKLFTELSTKLQVKIIESGDLDHIIDKEIEDLKDAYVEDMLYVLKEYFYDYQISEYGRSDFIEIRDNEYYYYFRKLLKTCIDNCYFYKDSDVEDGQYVISLIDKLNNMDWDDPEYEDLDKTIQDQLNDYNDIIYGLFRDIYDMDYDVTDKLDLLLNMDISNTLLYDYSRKELCVEEERIKVLKSVKVKGYNYSI